MNECVLNNFITGLGSTAGFRAFGQFAEAGTDICILRFEFMKLLCDHPYTEKRLNGFTADWKNVFGEKTWPEAP